jgi:phosphoribosylamine--glycine ligase
MEKSRRRILVVGSGAREHAIAMGIKSGASDREVIVAPGNPGMSDDVTVRSDIPEDVAEGAKWISELEPDLVVIGPEKPLSLGLGDLLKESTIPVIGPTRNAARIESSKVFAKKRMQAAGIPTAQYQVVSSAEETRELSRAWGFPVVLKADGLAQGKGVAVIHDPDELEHAIDRFFVKREFREAQDLIYLEKGLSGPEASFIVLTDGKKFIPFPVARDYKRIGDGDRGPNTGGMGAVTPLDFWTDADQSEACHIVERCLWSLSKVGAMFVGFLYAGLMKTKEGLRVLEFNARFGDPEAQVLIPAAGDSYYDMLTSAASGNLDTGHRMASEPRVAVVLASRGYPDNPETGYALEGVDAARRIKGARIYTAGVSSKDGRVVTSGGRVLTATGEGVQLSDARKIAYEAIGMIRLEGGQYRRDIGIVDSR